MTKKMNLKPPINRICFPTCSMGYLYPYIYALLQCLPCLLLCLFST